MRFPYKTEPFPHQREIFEATHDLEAHALFLEMGTGKTKILIDTAAALWFRNEINAVLVLAPKAVAPNWVNDELPTHMPELPYRAFLWDTAKAGNKGFQAELKKFFEDESGELRVLVMSYDALMTERRKGAAKGLKKGKEAAQLMLKEHKALLILDESARIKSPDAKRTKRVMAAAPHAKYRRIATGTPVTNSPFDVYTQLKFLDPQVWAKLGCSTFAAFKAMFGVWIEHVRKDNGQKFQQLVDYQNIGLLHKEVDRLGSRMLKEDVLDLPEKVYSKREFDMSPAQRKLYDELKKEFMVWLDSGELITAPLAITRMLRLQQITSGYCPTDDGGMVMIEPNPRLTCLGDVLEDVPHQAIIWAKFHQDIDEICGLIGEDNCVAYDGRTTQDEREERRNKFLGGEVQFFVANPAAAGEGLTFTNAKTVIYYNTSFKLADRLQSEDRAHRIGQDRSVQYIDIIASGTIDRHIVAALRRKNNLAAQVTGDQIKEWI